MINIELEVSSSEADKSSLLFIDTWVSTVTVHCCLLQPVPDLCTIGDVAGLAAGSISSQFDQRGQLLRPVHSFFVSKKYGL